MMIVYGIALVVLMAFVGRAHGVGQKDRYGNPTGWPAWSRSASTAIMGIVFAIANYILWDDAMIAVAFGCITVAAFSTGHGNVYAMKGVNPDNDGPEFLEEVFRRFYRGDIHAPAYSWYIMGLKGFFIGLAAFPYGLPLAILWPAAYAFSFRKFNDSAPAEWISGGFAGAVLALTFLV